MVPFPVEHIRIVDLTQAWAGTYATQMLADFGAEVIKIEAPQRPDPWRFGIGSQRVLPYYPKDGPGERAYNRAFWANSVNRNKLGITLDLSRERGRELFCRLVTIADVVVENFTPHVMPDLELSFETLHRLRPGLVMLSMPGFGGSGPYSEYPGVGGTVEPMSGNSYLLGYEGGPPLNSGVMYPDPVAGVAGGIALLLAIHYRERTGLGQHIDLSQQEAMATMIGYHFVAHSLTGQTPQRQGNQHPAMAPHRNYRCLGEDEWVAIAVRDDGEWARLCQAMDRPGLGGDLRFATIAARLENRTATDSVVEAWTSRRPVEEVESALLAAGVPVGKVRNLGEIHDCPQLNARQFFVAPDHPEVGRRRTAGVTPRLSRSPGSVRRAAPCFGQHSAIILREYLGLTDAEVADLVVEGITGETPTIVQR